MILWSLYFRSFYFQEFVSSGVCLVRSLSFRSLSFRSLSWHRFKYLNFQYWSTLLMKTVLVKCKSEISKYFLLFDVHKWKTWIYFKWASIYRVACPMYIWNLHFSIFSEARNACQVTLCRETTNEKNEFSKWNSCIFHAILIRQSLEGYCCESELKLCLYSL